MSETFVDLSYRGLALGKRIKLTQVRPGSGYLEMPQPMPVGSMIGITTDDGVTLDATVAEIHEQVSGSDSVPGMRVRPALDVAAADAWWKAHVSADEPGPAPVERSAPAADTDGKVTLRSQRPTGQGAAPEIIDDGRNTAVMSVIDPSGSLDTLVADVPLDTDPVMPVVPREAVAPSARDTIVNLPPAPPAPPLVDDAAPQEEASRTMMMDAVDLAALGLGSPSGQMAAVKPEDYVDDTGDKPEASGATKAKKKRKRR